MRHEHATSYWKTGAALVLMASVLLPIYSLSETAVGARLQWPAGLAREDGGAAALIALAYLWPVIVFLVKRLREGSSRRAVSAVAESVLPLLSVLSILTISSAAMGTASVFVPWFIVPVSATPAIGAIIAVAADIVYLVVWVVSLARRGRTVPATG